MALFGWIVFFLVAMAGTLVLAVYFWHALGAVAWILVWVFVAGLAA